MPDHGARKLILVLSDAEDVQMVIRDVMEDEGYRVSTDAYLTGDIERVERSTPDAILIDCNRLDLDESVAYLRAVRAVPHLRDIPIIASTSAVRIIDDYGPQVAELGLQVLRKPFDIEIMAEVVAASLERHPSARS